MSEVQLSNAPDLPPWTKALKDRYLNTETGQFILHGNVHDLVLCQGQAWSLPDFLDAFLMPSGKLVVHFDPGRGIWFATDEHAYSAAQAFVTANFIDEAKLAPMGMTQTPKRIITRNLAEQLGYERSPEIVLEAMEVLLSDPNLAVAAVIHYAELVAPDGDIASLNFHDRTASARLHRWSIAENIVHGDNVVLMLTGTFSDLSRRLTRNPRVGALHIRLPNEGERASFLAHISPGLSPERGHAMTRITAGLQLRQIQDLATTSANAANSDESADTVFTAGGALPLEQIAARKKEILEQECYGLIEVIEPHHGFDVVGGMAPIKDILNRVASHVRDGRRKQVPMGILFVGPMGTGKTFIAEAFAKESGLSAIKLKNFRDKWVGSTEANLEKVLNVVEALGEILVIIDEGDRSIGGGAGGGSDVGSRVIARLKEFMSDTSHRGHIIFVMMTNPPDKLDTDIKRPGRFDLKIPFFPPQTAEARLAIADALFRRHKIDIAMTEAVQLAIMADLEGYAAADLEAVILLAYDDFQGGICPPGVKVMPERMTAAFLERAAKDFMPTREVDMIEYMQLLAIYEASNRRMLPPAYRDIDVGELNQQIHEKRAQLVRQNRPI
ncbi:MAG: ATP-binding protein [Myxococcota bacterium]|nr:ATP-binding protein [Myxococcota bacterium]